MAAFFGTDKTTAKRVQGLSHTYKALSEAENTTYVLHFIKFAGLVPLQTYYYKVQSGLPGGVESKWFNFRAPAAADYDDDFF